jgi:hypothetical protein
MDRHHPETFAESQMPIKTERRALLALLLMLMLLAGVKTYAQSSASLWDASQLPETRGTVRQYTLTPRGEVDGLILNDGTEVKVPPHLTGQIVLSIRPGDVVTIHGLRAKAVALVDAASITNDASGKTIVDNGPPGPAALGTETVSGRVVLVLHGKRGEVNGALLENGATVRLPPPEADRMQALLRPGLTIAVHGGVLTTVLGTVIDRRPSVAHQMNLTNLSIHRRMDREIVRGRAPIVLMPLARCGPASETNHPRRRARENYPLSSLDAD